jgi:GTPase
VDRTGTRALARLLSRVEAGERVETLPPGGGSPGKARVVGITGAPGVGKSTMTSALIARFRAAGKRVGVLAIDPSSPFTGGALLGDRIRMQEHATDDGVFIRSMASRGHLGGLAAATPRAVRVLDAAGFDVIIVETVGVGQAEVAIASQADTVIVLLAPGMGDAVQAAKAGILETGDLFVVNKADKPDAQAVVRDLRGMLALGNRDDGWKPRVLTTIAQQAEGVAEVAGALGAHWDWLSASGELGRRRLARAEAEIVALAMGSVRARVCAVDVASLASEVAAGALDPSAAAAGLLSAAGLSVQPGIPERACTPTATSIPIAAPDPRSSDG